MGFFENMDNIRISDEDNYSSVNKLDDIYDMNNDGLFICPVKEGVSFPTDNLKERANIAKTLDMLYNNKLESVFNDMLLNLPGISGQTYDLQLRNVCMKLPYFKNTVDIYTSLVLNNGIVVDINKNENESERIVSKTDLKKVIADSFKNEFTCGSSLFITKKNKLNNVIVENIASKNYVIYKDPEDVNTIHSYFTFSITDNGLECIEYINTSATHLVQNPETGENEKIEVENGDVLKYKYNYSNGKVGELIFFSKAHLYNKCPCVFISNNIESQYGRGLFYDFASSVLSVITIYNSMTKIAKRSEELVRIAPEETVEANPILGPTSINMGAVTYESGKSKDVRPTYEFVMPEIKDNMEGLKNAYEKALDTLSLASNISKAFFDIQKLGRVSGEALKVSLYSTTMRVKSMMSDREFALRDIIQNILSVNGIEVDKDLINLSYRVGVADTDKEKLDYTIGRIKAGLWSRTDGIKYLDNTSTFDATNVLNDIDASYGGEVLGDEYEIVENKDDSITENEGNSKLDNEDNNKVIDSFENHDISQDREVSDEDSQIMPITGLLSNAFKHHKE